MKKFLALILCLMMACVSIAVAEETAIEDLYDGSWVQFEDGFEIYLPNDWCSFECTEEMNAQGIFYVAGTEDMSYSCTLAWKALDAEISIEDLQAQMVQTYPDAEVVEVNGVGLITYVDSENNLLNCVAMDAAEPGFYLFAFSPADDADFQMVAAAIASSIRNY